MKRTLIFSGLIALAVSLATTGVFSLVKSESKTVKIEHVSGTPSKSAVFTLDDNNELIPLDFTKTADKVIDGVVNIKSTHIYAPNRKPPYQQRDLPDPFRDFFGDEFERFFGPFGNQQPGNGGGNPPTRVGSGSGVIISEDGYIVTNNHVIADADDIEVTLHDNRTYKASIIGTDPSTDLALIRIKEEGLTTIPFTDSDEVKVGEWVLAVGNPFSLNSTITAGIISAKGRNINILREQYAVEDFIQTDAAINPGNSGGALVNLEGGLVGINTAIASPTGTYSGYGFAVPANIVKKVVEDLIKYGSVQRGVLGIMIRTVDGNFAKEKDLEVVRGVWVDSLMANSAAATSGVKVGDVITHVNDVKVNSSPELQGIIARHRPGEQVTLTVNRKGQQKQIDVVLNNRQGTQKLASKEEREIISLLGAEFETLDASEAQKLQIKEGIKVTRLYAGKLSNQTDMQEGFVITKVDGKPVKSVEELIKILEKKQGGVMLEGVYEDFPGTYYYAFGIEN